MKAAVFSGMEVETGGMGGVSRREMFSAAGLAAAWAASMVREAAASPPSAAADVDPASMLRKLVRRTTFGINDEQMYRVGELGYNGYLEYQLAYEAISDTSLDLMLAMLPTLNLAPFQLYALSPGLIQAELVHASLLRAIYSKRQLYQRTVELWTDHFHVDVTTDPARYIKTVNDREVIRPHAMGTFPQLLRAVAYSPAMLVYLNNDRSVVGEPNENFARELMELHTLGVDAGYSQTDVDEIARCFTGWGVVPRCTTDTTAGTFRFDPARHDNGQKIVLGNVIPAGGGQQDGETVLAILANHPGTAKRVAGKICRWFYGEDASQSLVNSVAAVYTATGGGIKPMIRAVLAPNVLYGAAPKLKRPFHQFVSAFRVLPATISSVAGLRYYLNISGHEPFIWPAPNGYPDTLEYWSGGMLPRWNFGASLLAGLIGGADVDYAFLHGLVTAAQVVDWIDDHMFASEMPAADKERIRQYLLPDPPYISFKREAIGLAIASPGFQWY